MANRPSAARLEAIIKRHKPHGVTIKWHEPKSVAPRRLKGSAHYTDRVIESPRVSCRNTLYLFLHECGHFRAGHPAVDLPMHLEEYEAERWAINTMRAEGLHVPRGMLREAKRYVRECITHDRRLGLTIKAHVVRWARVR